MKILASSRFIYSQLEKIDFEKEYIERITLVDNELVLITQTGSIRIYCHVISFAPSIKQVGRKWDWVKNLLKHVDDQPVVLEINEKCVNAVFQY